MSHNMVLLITPYVFIQKCVVCLIKVSEPLLSSSLHIKSICPKWQNIGTVLWATVTRTADQSQHGLMQVDIESTIYWAHWLLKTLPEWIYQALQQYQQLIWETFLISLRLGLWADALHGSTRLIFFLQYIHSYIYNK